MRDYAGLVARLKQSDDNCNAECCECSGECLSSGCNIFSEAADAIEELHAKVPKQGEWLPHQNAQFIEADVCSVCGIGTRKMYHCTDGIQTWDEKPFFRYCPWCGAKLSEPPKGVE